MPKKGKHSHRQAQHASKEKRKVNAVTTEAENKDQRPGLSSQPSVTCPHPTVFVKGLSNHGNCCFFNALMQMLASSALLSSTLVTQELHKLKEYGPCISTALAGINSLGTAGQPFSVRPLLKLLAQKYSFMDGYTQQDSHEALMLLLDMLDEEFKVSQKDNGRLADSGVEKSKDKAVIKEKTAKPSAKEKKARLKAEKRAERQKRKGRNSHHAAFDDDGSGDEGDESADAETLDVAKASDKDEALPAVEGMPELCRDASRALVQSMDLQQSMRERHGWSAPWLPGLWLMPDGSVFHPAQSSLLVSLQMYFERENGIMWKCPNALVTTALEQQRRQQRKVLQVRIAERTKRERVFEVPGRSHSTCRAIPGTDLWSGFTDGSQTWEKFWTCPYDPDNKIVIQVASVSEHSWFDNQHPSAIDDYNDPSCATTLTKVCDRLEVTLNKDLGNQYIETHQLAIPPVKCISVDKLQLLSSVSVRHANMSSEEYQMCVATIEEVIRKAQTLLTCVHDALTEVGVDGIGKLFGAPISLLHDGKDAWVYKVQGSYVSEGADLSVSTADIRKLFMKPSQDSEDTWLYPAPHTGPTTSTSEATVPHQTAAPALVVEVQPSGEAVAECELARREGSMEVLGDVESHTPTRERAAGMRRTDSWTQDKFTAQPGRTQFPALSDRNYLLGDIDTENDTADSSDSALPGTPESPCPPIFDGDSSRAADGSPEPVAEGARPSKRLMHATLAWSCAGSPPVTHDSTSKPIKAEESVHVPSTPPARNVSCGILPVASSAHTLAPVDDVGDSKRLSEGLLGDVSDGTDGSIDNNHTAPGKAVSGRRMPVGNLARSLSELKIQASDVEECSTQGKCDAPQHECKIHPDRTGILLYPDDGSRESERHVMLQELPPLLLCHLNRFQHSMLGTRKASVQVTFPFQLYVHPNVARRPSSSKPDDSCAVRYRLKAVLEHHGRQAGSGHYTSYVWRPSAVVAAAAKLQVAEKCPGGVKLALEASSKPMKAKAQPRDIERLRSRNKGGWQHSRSLGDSATVSELHSARQGSRSWEGCRPSSEGGRPSMEQSRPASLMGANDSVYTPGSSVCHASTLPCSHAVPETAELHLEETASVGGDLSVADWEELADMPAGLSSNAEQVSMPYGDVPDGGDGRVEDEEASQCAEEEPAADERLLQNLMFEDAEEDGGVWLKCDDERVFEVPWQTVSSAQAYMLMYEQAQCGVNKEAAGVDNGLDT